MLNHTEGSIVNLSWQTRLAVLWFIQLVNYTAYILISAQESITVLEADDAQSAMVLAVFYFIPCFVIWMNFIGNRRLSRWLNIVFGSLFTIIKLVATISAVSGGITRPDGTLSPALVFNEFWAILAAAFIVWYAWRDGAG
ncbi:MAG: hypothetical protein PVH89_05165 [Gammaproteobacteria bacterium]|jgi:hypothetical protein